MSHFFLKKNIQNIRKTVHFNRPKYQKDSMTLWTVFFLICWWTENDSKIVQATRRFIYKMDSINHQNLRECIEWCKWMVKYILIIWWMLNCAQWRTKIVYEKKNWKFIWKKKSTQSTEHLFFFLKKNNNTFLVCLFVNVCAFAQLTYWPFFFEI